MSEYKTYKREGKGREREREEGGQGCDRGKECERVMNIFVR